MTCYHSMSTKILSFWGRRATHKKARVVQKRPNQKDDDQDLTKVPSRFHPLKGKSLRHEIPHHSIDKGQRRPDQLCEHRGIHIEKGSGMDIAC